MARHGGSSGLGGGRITQIAGRLAQLQVAVELIGARNASGDIQLGDIIWGTLPFVFLIMFAVVLLCMFPGISTWMPDHFMGEAVRR